MIAIFLATYGAVFLAEIAGDKLLYTTGVLTTRFRTLPVMIGVTFAFMVKMAAAVLLGEWISHLNRWFVAGLTAVSFIGIAITVWRKPLRPRKERKKEVEPHHMAILISFATIVMSEWGDVGQLTAATMAARYGVAWAVWFGAVAAMVTKGALAASVGTAVRLWIQDHIPPKIIRWGGVSALVVLGVLSVLESMGILAD
jgi:putative Ca2+/H+ antiporter (TMEM165/GDT1 family)